MKCPVKTGHLLLDLACQDLGSGLRKRTLVHLQDLTVSREYIVSRYEPEIHTALSQIYRLMATRNVLKWPRLAFHDSFR